MISGHKGSRWLVGAAGWLQVTVAIKIYEIYIQRCNIKKGKNILDCGQSDRD